MLMSYSTKRADRTDSGSVYAAGFDPDDRETNNGLCACGRGFFVSDQYRWRDQGVTHGRNDCVPDTLTYAQQRYNLARWCADKGVRVSTARQSTDYPMAPHAPSSDAYDVELYHYIQTERNESFTF